MMIFDMVTPTTGNNRDDRVYNSYEHEEEDFGMDFYDEFDELALTEEDFADVLDELEDSDDFGNTDWYDEADETDDYENWFNDIDEADEFDEEEDFSNFGETDVLDEIDDLFSDLDEPDEDEDFSSFGESDAPENLFADIDELDDEEDFSSFGESENELEYDDIFGGDSGFTEGTVFKKPFSQENTVSFCDSYPNITEEKAQMIEEEIVDFFSETTADPDVIAVCLAIMLSLSDSGRKLDDISDLEITIKANMVIDRDERTQIENVIPELRYLIGFIENTLDDKYNHRLYKYYHLFFRNP